MAGSGSSPLSAALPDETYNEMPQEAQEALDELGEWDITTECRADYARRMSHYSTYLETNGMEGLLPEDSDVELPGKCRAHYRGSKTKYWPNRIDYHKVSFQNFRAYCAQARKTVKGGEPGATQLYSHTDIRKMKDALLYHLRIVQVTAPHSPLSSCIRRTSNLLYFSFLSLARAPSFRSRARALNPLSLARACLPVTHRCPSLTRRRRE